MASEDEAVTAAYAVLARIENSGYGTTRPDRYTPRFDVDEVSALADYVIAVTGGVAP